MKIGRNKLLWLIFFIWTVLLANTNYAQEDNRKYVYKDNDSKGTVYVEAGKTVTIMPARAAEKSIVRHDPKAIGFDGIGTSVKLIFSRLREPPKWAGVVFTVEDQYWGEEKENHSSHVLNLLKAKKLVFFAKGERGGEQIQVKAAIAADKPNGDSALVPFMTSWIILTADWKRYEFTVDNASQLERVITPFAVITSLSYNPEGEITIYLDEIYYELEE